MSAQNPGPYGPNPGPGYGYGPPPGPGPGYGGGPGPGYGGGPNPGPYGAPWGGPPGPPPAPQPGVIPLRPLTLSDILSAVFSTVGRYWRQIYGVLVSLIGVAFLISTAVIAIAIVTVRSTLDHVISADRQSAGLSTGYAGPDGGQIATLVVVGVVALLVIGVVWLYVYSALHAVHAVLVSRAVTGSAISAGELWRTARPRVGSVIGVQLVVSLITGGLMLAACGIVALFIAGAVARYDSVEPSPGLILLVVFGSLLIVGGTAAAVAYFSVRFLFAPTAATLEGGGTGAALSRSTALVRRVWWRTFGIMLVIGVAVSVIQQIIQYPLSIFSSSGISASMAARGSAPDLEMMITWMCLILLIPVLGSLIAVPFTYVTNSLLYVDMRIRREGFDLVLGQAAGLPAHRPTTY